jgi:single-strand DNA-binding protein
MASLNEVRLLGRLGRDPETRQAGSSTVCEFSIATDYKYKSKTGDYETETEWHRITVWGKQAEACGRYLEKGREVVVRGRIKSEKWQDKEGKDRYTTKIVADNFGGVLFLGGRQDGGDQQQQEDRPKTTKERRDWGDNTTAGQPLGDDDIPF